MLGDITVVQTPAVQWPPVSTAGQVSQPKPTIVPSVVECQGRTTSISVSERTGDVIGGGDVAPPQRWREPDKSWRGYAAGGGNDGSTIAYPNKKTCAVREGPTYAIWMSGSNGSGALWRRDDNDALWDLATQSFWGTVNDGGSSDPRRTGAGLIVIDGTSVFVSCERSAGPTNGIARSTDSGANYTAWSFGTSRNYTCLRKSPNFEYLLACSDGRVGASQDGVWLLTGLGGTVAITQWDTIGTGAPDLADVRYCFPVDENGDDCWFIVVGNAAGSDADRGIWRLRVTHDPLDGGFVAATHMTWAHIYTPGLSDRMQTVVAHKPNGASAGPVFLMAGYFNGSTNATGTYDLSPGAGGSTQNYRVRAVRSLDADATTPSFTVVSNSTNVDMVTYGTRHEHVLTYVGEQSNEKGRMGGSSYQMQELAISDDGLTVYACGKSSPWVTPNPWGLCIWQPFSRGMGLLEGGYASVYVPDIGDGRLGFAIADDDRGLYTFRNLNLSAKGPEWVVAENIDGAITTDNAMNGVSVDVGTPITLLLPRRLNGRAYRVEDPFDYDNAQITAMAPDTSADTPAIGAFAWIDSTTTDRRVIVTSGKIWRDLATVVSGLSSNSKRTEFVSQGAFAWLLIPDKGIYRTADNGATWTLWWNHGIASTTTNRYAGHMTLLPPDTLLVTWDTAGIWECTDADVSAVGSGIAGSRPGSTNLLTSGLMSPTEFVSALDYDAQRGDVWACGYDPTGSSSNILWVRRASSGAWVAIFDTEYAESAIIPQALTAHDGRLIIGTASNGSLLRVC